MRPELDRRPRWDDRSLSFRLRPYLAGAVRRKTVWKTTDRLPLNQRTGGGSVGFGWASMMEQVDSVGFPATEQAIRAIVEGASLDDARPGGYVVGQSLLGAARHLKRNGFISGYRWAFDVDEVLDCLCVFGPILLGIPWFESMYNPRPDGILEVNGPGVGGHVLLADAYIPVQDAMRMNLGPTELIRVIPSLGRGYGVGGRAYLRVMDLKFLMKPENAGEGVVPLNMRATEHLEGLAAFMARRSVRFVTSPFRRD